jgi:RNA-directed DNA polymerase
MEESYREGVANHPDPESCGVVRKGGAEALTGAHAGQVLSREINESGVPTPLPPAEGHIRTGVSASPCWTPRGLRP